ncbi:MAG: lysophospholipid acyltransferase family protein [Saprospiraceae bacterium]|jgi:KDO2-lipid IV(A) lauroyltransferase|nr:lysophospholipid acyltransferase family protein [Saprospiraceae bacterium]
MLKRSSIFSGISHLLLRWVKYPGVFRVVSGILYKLLRWRRGYRSSTIEKNLADCPQLDLSLHQITEVKDQYYNVLHRYLMEIMLLAAQKNSLISDWVGMDGEDVWRKWFSNQKSTIITGSHYGNWEIVIPLLPALLKMDVIAFYKPLKQKAMDEWAREIRGRYGLELQPIDQTFRVMSARRHQNIAYVFIGDQSPVNLNGAYWNLFLGRRTPWLTGAEKLAKKFGYPVVYLQQVPVETKQKSIQPRLQREEGHSPLYRITFHLITDTPATLPDGLVTEHYTRLLEEEILREPKWWLWSHRRWKRAGSDQREELESGRFSGLH